MSEPTLIGGEATAAAPSPALAPPPGNPRFPLFDGLRGAALLAVLAFHTAEYSGHIGLGPLGRLAEALGPDAIIVFFILSGFLLYRPFASTRAAGRKLPSTGRYLRRRALRILPAYWFALTLLAIYPGVHGVFTSHWWRYYGFLQVYSSYGRSSGIDVAWTLCVEATFYAALPLWAMVMRRVPGASSVRGFLRSELACLGVVAAGGILVQLAVSRNHLPYALGVSLIGESPWIVIGMALAVVSVACTEDPEVLRWVRAAASRPNLCWLLAAACAGGLMVLVPKGGLFGLIASAQYPESLAKTLAKLALEATLAAAFTLPAVFDEGRQGIAHRVLGFRTMIRLGVVGYGFYLYHMTVVQLLAVTHVGTRDTGLGLVSHLHVAPTTILFVLTFAVTYVLASASYQFVELPFLRLKERRRIPVRDVLPEEHPPAAARIIDAS
jgi:peptidoglycan/LPS O-acetylase OafA/YrhL